MAPVLAPVMTPVLAPVMDHHACPQQVLGRYHIFCEGPTGVFILGQTDADLMEGVQCFLSELAKQAMGGDMIEIAELNKFGF